MTKNKNYAAKGAIVVHSKEELLEELKKYPEEDIFVIGGESIYRMLLPYCTTAYVTRTDYAYDADTYFQIWMNCQNGNWWKRVKKKPISISNTGLQNTKNRKQQLTSEKKSFIIYSINYKQEGRDEDVRHQSNKDRHSKS